MTSAIEITPVGGGTFRLHTRLVLPRPRDEVFPFFADARNLEALTPALLKFSIVTRDPQIYQGALLDYRLRIHGVPINWRTEITCWDPPIRFIDRQVRGPYRLWHHLHTFEDAGATTVCEDVVHYRPVGGAAANPIVARDLRKIFSYRAERLRHQFD